MVTLLVANRGEIAIRVFRTARRMGLRTVAVYSDADAAAPHVRAADASVRIGPAPASESYLRRDRILEAARVSGSGLIHPGYGFLAEDDRFAADCEDAGITFVGPPSSVLRTVGDKASARALAVAAGVPVLPGYTGDDQSDAAFHEAARNIGFPLVVKPAGGGGGKGMAVVRMPGDLADARASAMRIARAAFGDDRLILERYLDHPRHVEVQVLADVHGNVLHLGERDCSLQRRYQKILEESPAPNLDHAVRERLHDSAVAFARHAGYVGAGTCEFLVGAQLEVGFIEMNARLQVEHPVTEMVTGLDLVELQLRVAMGEPLPLAQEDVHATGHAIEVRVYAEDPEGFLPQAGRILHVRWPQGVRVDTGVEEGTDVSTHYDPLIAKLTVHAEQREVALDSLRRGLSQLELLGVFTNVTFLRGVIDEPVVRAGEITTDWLEASLGESGWSWPSRPVEEALAPLVAAAAEAETILSAREVDPWSALGPWRAGRTGTVSVVLRGAAEGEHVYVVEGTGPFLIRDGSDARVFKAPDCHGWFVGEEHMRAAAARGHDRWESPFWYVWIGDMPFEVCIGPSPRAVAQAVAGRIESPLPGRVVQVRARSGEHVKAGEELVVVEAMKMEHSIKAPVAGTVRAVLCAPGDQVERGQSLIDFEPA